MQGGRHSGRRLPHPHTCCGRLLQRRLASGRTQRPARGHRTLGDHMTWLSSTPPRQRPRTSPRWLCPVAFRPHRIIVFQLRLLVTHLCLNLYHPVCRRDHVGLCFLQIHLLAVLHLRLLPDFPNPVCHQHHWRMCSTLSYLLLPDLHNPEHQWSGK